MHSCVLVGFFCVCVLCEGWGEGEGVSLDSGCPASGGLQGRLCASVRACLGVSGCGLVCLPAPESEYPCVHNSSSLCAWLWVGWVRLDEGDSPLNLCLIPPERVTGPCWGLAGTQQLRAWCRPPLLLLPPLTFEHSSPKYIFIRGAVGTSPAPTTPLRAQPAWLQRN